MRKALATDEKDPYICEETYIYEKIPIFMKRDLCIY